MGPGKHPYSVPIEELRLGVRCYNLLKRDGIDTVGQLAVLPRRHLLGLRNFAPKDMDVLEEKLGQLGLSPWTGQRSGGGFRPVSGWQPGRLWRCALRAAGAMLPAVERDRWAEEWAGELRALGSWKARARFTLSLLLAGGRRLAVTIRQALPGDKPGRPAS